jgi:hypothetical protein
MRCNLRERRRLPALAFPRGSFGKSDREILRHFLFLVRHCSWGMPLQEPESPYSPAFKGPRGPQGLQGPGKSLLSLESLQSLGSFLPLQGLLPSDVLDFMGIWA